MCATCDHPNCPYDKPIPWEPVRRGIVRELLSQRCGLCGSRVTECGCILGKPPVVLAALNEMETCGDGKAELSEFSA